MLPAPLEQRPARPKADTDSLSVTSPRTLRGGETHPSGEIPRRSFVGCKGSGLQQVAARWGGREAAATTILSNHKPRRNHWENKTKKTFFYWEIKKESNDDKMESSRGRANTAPVSPSAFTPPSRHARYSAAGSAEQHREALHFSTPEHEGSDDPADDDMDSWCVVGFVLSHRAAACVRASRRARRSVTAASRCNTHPPPWRCGTSLRCLRAFCSAD